MYMAKKRTAQQFYLNIGEKEQDKPHKIQPKPVNLGT